jgi:hypothetical protein
VTYAFLRHRSPLQCSVGLRHVARLADGREVLLLDDRGFTSRLRFALGDRNEPIGDAISDGAARQALESDARTCVGPDEPPPGCTWQEAVHAHNALLADVLLAAGVSISAEDVGTLPHDVVLDDALREATQPR